MLLLSYVLWLAKKLAPSFQPIRLKTKTNRNFLTHVFRAILALWAVCALLLLTLIVSLLYISFPLSSFCNLCNFGFTTLNRNALSWWKAYYFFTFAYNLLTTFSCLRSSLVIVTDIPLCFIVSWNLSLLLSWRSIQNLGTAGFQWEWNSLVAQVRFFFSS